jgi:hypothetical protein
VIVLCSSITSGYAPFSTTSGVHFGRADTPVRPAFWSRGRQKIKEAGSQGDFRRYCEIRLHISGSDQHPPLVEAQPVSAAGILTFLRR